MSRISIGEDKIIKQYLLQKFYSGNSRIMIQEISDTSIRLKMSKEEAMRYLFFRKLQNAIGSEYIPEIPDDEDVAQSKRVGAR
jgi:hypothetical protein